MPLSSFDAPAAQQMGVLSYVPSVHLVSDLHSKDSKNPRLGCDLSILGGGPRRLSWGLRSDAFLAFCSDFRGGQRAVRSVSERWAYVMRTPCQTQL